jgi:hypothetical protein
MDAMEKFLFYVDKTDNCWIWTGGTVRGYGLATNTIDNSKKQIYAHRLSWCLFNGGILGGMLVLHKCDNPSCVNPEHLFLGSHKDNAIDRESKGRGNRPIGENNPSAKLTNKDVCEIRESCDEGDSISRIAERYGVTQKCIYDIRSNRTWNEKNAPD